MRIDLDALDAWLELHPITQEQLTQVVLMHLLAEVIRLCPELVESA